MKAETYTDKQGVTWLVWWDKDGNADYNTWTTNTFETVPTHKYEIYNDKMYLFVHFEIVLFPNGLYGFGFKSNFLEKADIKVSSTKAVGNSFETELEALQRAASIVIKSKIKTKYFEEGKSLLETIEKDLIPKTLF